MKISTKLIILALLPLCTSIFLGLNYYNSNKSLQYYISHDEKLDEILSQTNRLRISTHEFSQYKYDRIEEQWFATSKKITHLVKAINTDSTSNQVIYNHIATRINNTIKLFKILTNDKHISQSDFEHQKKHIELYNRVSGQLISNLNAIDTDLMKIKSSSSKEIVDYQSAVSASIIWSIIITFGMTLIIGVYVFCSIKQPISKLTLGVKALTKGDLGHVIALTSKNELGELAKEFNFMSIRLRETTEKLKSALNDSHQSERRLYESENRMRSVLDTTTSLIYLKDIKGTYTFVNKQYATILDRAQQDVIGKKDENIFPEKTTLQHTIDENLVISKRTSIKTEETLLDKNGISRIYSTVKFPLFDESGTLYLICGFFTEITDIRIAEHTLKNINQDLENKINVRTMELQTVIKDLESFSYSVAHDLRSPLRSISGFSSFLLDSYHDQLDEKGKHYLDRIMHGATRMDEIIDSLLGLARMSKKTISKESVNLSDIVNSIIARLNSPQQNIAFEIEENVLSVADNNLVTIVLENLIDNALKYCANVSHIKIKFGVLNKLNETVYYVKDNGCGFEGRYSEKIFLPFQRLHSQEEYSGTGIGLATVARIIQHHGGRIWAESEPSQGATFYFTLKAPEVKVP